MLIHANIKPLKAYVAQEFLYDLDEAHRGLFDRCVVFGVSSYARNALTFQIVLADGSLFSYIPLHALYARPPAGAVQLAPAELLYRNCPSERFVVTEYAYLIDAKVDAFFHARAIWLSGDYFATIDWPDDNEQLHLVRLENGQLAALPNHKLKFDGGERSFLPYRKLRQTWRV